MKKSGHAFEFNQKLYVRSSRHGKRDDGWSVQGYYQTKTSLSGESTLSIKGELIAPYNLNASSTYMVWAFGSEKLVGTEIFIAGW